MCLDDPSLDPFHDWLAAKNTAELVRQLQAAGLSISGQTVRNWRNGTHPPHRAFWDAIKKVAAADGWELTTDHLMVERRK